ncbi:MAG TPA: PilN domain-containing protein [Burkholderiales bacterium]|nr:PilN domain-containing protein [Burkholderiales bacterium]
MKPVRLELDHLLKTPRPARISWLLLVIALGFAADVGYSYTKSRLGVEAKTAQLARLSNALPGRNAGTPLFARPLSQEEFAAAQDTILRLSMPWDNVFRALESARSDDIALLSIEPDTGSGSVNIAGEARSYPAALTYVAWLSHEKTLKNVRLAKHEFVQNDSRRPLAFTISADWKEKR